jgi:hypothetical protein
VLRAGPIDIETLHAFNNTIEPAAPEEKTS